MVSDGYFQATRHPWSALLFVLPLLAIYEACLLVVGPDQAEGFRNGADTWLRWALANLGLASLLWAPVILLAILAVWSFHRRQDRPEEWLSIWAGILFESMVFAFALWSLSRGFCPFIENLGLQIPAPHREIDPGLENLLSYLGAGIYEEAVFRLLLFSGLIWIFQLVDMPVWWSQFLAALVSAAAFAIAHNLGPHGEPFHNLVFLFRTFAGLYFAVLFQLRGFGIAVGAHTGYDVLVGLMAAG